MNVKQTVQLRELIRQELTVRDALEKVCVDYAQGGMDERRKKNLEGLFPASGNHQENS